MSYSSKVSPGLDKIFSKLIKKNRRQYEIIMKKVEEILENPQHYKNLRAPLQSLKEVHINGHFILTFSVDENTKIITFEGFYHHDEIFG